MPAALGANRPTATTGSKPESAGRLKVQPLLICLRQNRRARRDARSVSDQQHNGPLPHDPPRPIPRG